ncbi:MAG: RecB-family nuclease [Candidatus Thorarchaeota archaeon]
MNTLNDDFKNVYVVLHNVHSTSKTIETAQVVYGLGFTNYVVSKAEGSAAQSGVPDANRLAVKMKRNFMVLPDLDDVLETLQIDNPILITSPKLTKQHLEFSDIKSLISSGKRIALILSGSTSSFSRKEMDKGECKSIRAEVDIGPAGTAAVILYALRSENQSD